METIDLLKQFAAALIDDCSDADLLDLICKILAAESDASNC